MVANDNKWEGLQMKLATRINSFLPVNDNDLRKVFKKFKSLGLNYVDLNYPEHVKDYSSAENESAS